MKHRLYECKGWHNVRLQLEDEIRSCEQIAKHSVMLCLWVGDIASFPGACLVDMEVGWAADRS